MEFYYDWIKAFHLVSVIAWLTGLFYLPRLFVYHADVEPDSEAAKIFVIMERRLLRVIMNPALLASWGSGLTLLFLRPDLVYQGWMVAKFLGIAGLTALHLLFAGHRKRFLERVKARTWSAKRYRAINEMVTIFMILIVIMVIVRPF